MTTTTKTTSSSHTTVNGLVTRREFNGLATDPFTWAEIQRILQLPIIRPMDSHELSAFNLTHIQATAYEKGFRFLEPQAEGLATYEQYGCLFGNIGVGWGKTLTTLMIANAAYTKGHTRIVLFVPPEVLSQLTTTDIPWARSRVAINYPIHILGGKPLAYRRSLCSSKRKGLYIFPYSLLSTKDSEENLCDIAPQTVIADEAHRLANSSAARTRRFMRVVEEFKPELALLSGTMTRKTIKDYYHLIKNCLGDKCPLPTSTSMANDWAALIDAEAASPDAPPAAAGDAPILPLVAWAQKFFPNTPGGFPQDVYGFRRAYKHRLNTCPGVVPSGDTVIGTSLVMHNAPVTDYEANPTWPALKKLMDQVTEMWLTPNGDEIDHAIHTWKWLNELSGAGFYNELTWPVTAEYAQRKGIAEAHAADLLNRAQTHHASLQGYSRELRSFLQERSRPGIDTPLLVGLDMARNGAKHVGHDLYRAWQEAKALEFDGMPERDKRAVRVCDYKIAAAVAWVRELLAEGPKGAILWYYHQEAGTWLVEALHAAGVAAVHCPAGTRGNETIGDIGNKDKVMVASILAHCTGKNLQHFQHQYFLQWPRSASTAEQALGRLHRTGQTADELTVYTNQTTYFDQLNFAACINDALYIHQSTGSRQKLVYAVYDPRPKIFPPAVLVQQGLEVKALDSEQQKIMHEKFGD